jgi:hypothetical protein
MNDNANCEHMNTYLVLDYLERSSAHWVKDGSGTRRLVDLTRNGDLPENTDPWMLIGRTFTADLERPYIGVAIGVSESLRSVQLDANSPKYQVK